MLDVKTATPDVILYAQHGWADDHRAIASLAASLATPNTIAITPNLGYLKTWLRIEPLIQAVEVSVLENMQRYPTSVIRIVGHSMGGLIWLEVLARHPELWANVESLVLVGSPVGGADLARALDPLGVGVGIARDLGINRREIAEAIAAKIPTLVIAGDIDNGSDGTVTVQCTKIFGAEFVRLLGIHHAALKNHPAVAEAIRQFWAIAAPPSLPDESSPDFSRTLIRRLQSVPGMTDAHERDFAKAEIVLVYDNGVTIRTWKNLMGIDHVFVACPHGQCLYSGFVGWLHAENLRQTLDQLQQEQVISLV
ncbi:MAG: lysophospholipase [Oscillatoriales cyanobacterium C42_A2020_001]|nr:lysophospholipase [Leptolyngbyaceae cyanobacterium C42_A2020_001]